MTKKEYLEQAKKLEEQIESKLITLERLRIIAERKDAILKQVVVDRCRDNHEFDRTMSEIVDLQREINADAERLVRLKTEITMVIAEIKHKECMKVLTKKYLDYKKWTEIEAEMHLSKTRIYELHQEGLKKIKIPEKTI